MDRSHRLIRILVIGLLIFSSLACKLAVPRPGPEVELTVLAGSELKDLEFLLPEIERATRVKLTFTYSGTLEGAERIAAGETVDLAWFSHANYLRLLPGAAQRIRAEETIMISPVILGVKMSKAKAWGWVNQPNLTWKDVARKAASNDLRYAMTNPAASNSGFSGLVGVASSLAGQMDALQTEDINAVSDELKGFMRGQALTGKSSGWLADQYVRDQDRLGGMINYESVLLRLNKSDQLNEPLYLVYPKEGVFTADYPLLLLNTSQRAAYQKVVEYLRSPAVQQKLMTKTLHRPVNPQVERSNDFPTPLLVELPFPGSLTVVNQLLSTRLELGIKPVHLYFVLDTSKPMKGAQLDSLKKALYTLIGADASQTGRFTRYHNREKVTLVTFNNNVSARHDFDIDRNDPSSLRPLEEFIDELRAGGDSALYSALAKAYQQAARDKTDEPDRVYAIILMSYGKSNTGISEKSFVNTYRKLAGARSIRLFTLYFGDKEMGTVQSITRVTGGRMMIAGQESYSVIYNEIRGHE